MRKIILATAALVLLLGASPALAQVAGVWEGTGQGNAYPHPGVVIYPWQHWKGEIPNSQDAFTGTWYDSLGNHGIFKGKQVPSIPEVVVFKGAWYWYDPTGSAIPVYGGDFQMTFHFMEGYWCVGTWTTIWPSTGPQGTMIGYKVSPD